MFRNPFFKTLSVLNIFQSTLLKHLRRATLRIGQASSISHNLHQRWRLQKECGPLKAACSNDHPPPKGGTPSTVPLAHRDFYLPFPDSGCTAAQPLHPLLPSTHNIHGPRNASPCNSSFAPCSSSPQKSHFCL